jgi:hypothetical protein
MTTFFIGNWATLADFEALRDNGGFDAVDELAYPSGVLLLSRDPAHVQALLDAAWEDCTWQHDPDEDGPLPDPDWKTDGWHEGTKNDNETIVGYQRWESDLFECFVILRAIEPMKPKGGPA